MNKWKPNRTEFYEAASAMGYYGTDEGGLTGIKDNVRKFWEDIFIKRVCSTFIGKILSKKKGLRILEIGAGAGEGYDLLTHIPPSNPISTDNRHFLLEEREVEKYLGIDISQPLISKARKRFRKKINVSFEYDELGLGLPSFALQEKPFDLYASFYSSLSHLEPANVEKIFEQIFRHAKNGSFFVGDLQGKFSPSWPKYWAEQKLMLPYTMAFYVPQQMEGKKIEWFNICFWSIEELKKNLKNAAKNSGVSIGKSYFLDRSIFVGRHMDTGLLSTKPMPLRYQVNRLLDQGFRADISQLKVDLSHLEEYKDINPKVWERIADYQRQWNRIVYLLEALNVKDDIKVKNFIENTDIELMSDELKFITWLFRNADRFPVVDFWASIIGPQVGVILRNIEMSYEEGVGCGHGLVFAVEVLK
jgi:SAM-dependent methyltransferase